MDTRKETPGPGVALVESVPVMSIAGDVCRKNQLTFQIYPENILYNNKIISVKK